MLRPSSILHVDDEILVDWLRPGGHQSSGEIGGIVILPGRVRACAMLGHFDLNAEDGS
jgi:hypothetical protein